MRRLTTFINRLRANHFNVGESLARKNYIDTPRCQSGAEVETINHLLFGCVRYDKQRIEFRETLDRLGSSYPFDIWKWLREEEWKALSAAYKFLRIVNRIV